MGVCVCVHPHPCRIGGLAPGIKQHQMWKSPTTGPLGPDHQILSLQRLHRASPALRHRSSAHTGRGSCAQVAAEVAVAEGFEEVQNLLGWDEGITGGQPSTDWILISYHFLSG